MILRDKVRSCEIRKVVSIELLLQIEISQILWFGSVVYAQLTSGRTMRLGLKQWFPTWGSRTPRGRREIMWGSRQSRFLVGLPYTLLRRLSAWRLNNAQTLC